jgi:hypothetical protein
MNSTPASAPTGNWQWYNDPHHQVTKAGEKAKQLATTPPSAPSKMVSIRSAFLQLQSTFQRTNRKNFFESVLVTSSEDGPKLAPKEILKVSKHLFETQVGSPLPKTECHEGNTWDFKFRPKEEREAFYTKLNAEITKFPEEKKQKALKKLEIMMKIEARYTAQKAGSKRFDSLTKLLALIPEENQAMKALVQKEYKEHQQRIITREARQALKYFQTNHPEFHAQAQGYPGGIQVTEIMQLFDSNPSQLKIPRQHYQHDDTLACDFVDAVAAEFAKLLHISGDPKPVARRVATMPAVQAPSKSAPISAPTNGARLGIKQIEIEEMLEKNDEKLTAIHNKADELFSFLASSEPTEDEPQPKTKETATPVANLSVSDPTQKIPVKEDTSIQVTPSNDETRRLARRNRNRSRREQVMPSLKPKSETPEVSEPKTTPQSSSEQNPAKSHQEEINRIVLSREEVDITTTRRDRAVAQAMIGPYINENNNWLKKRTNLFTHQTSALLKIINRKTVDETKKSKIKQWQENLDKTLDAEGLNNPFFRSNGNMSTTQFLNLLQEHNPTEYENLKTATEALQNAKRQAAEAGLLDLSAVG